MSSRRFLPAFLAAGAAVTLSFAAGASSAATAIFFNNSGADLRSEQPGFATVSFSSSSRFAEASGYEYAKGVGAFASARVGSGHGYNNVQVTATAGLADQVRLGATTPGIIHQQNDVFAIFYSLRTSGTTGATNNPSAENPNFYSSGGGDYSFTYNVGGQGGFGGVDERAFENGTHSTTVSGSGAAQVSGVLGGLHLGDNFGVSFGARVFAFADGTVTASGIADFSHTLAWEGVQKIQVFNPATGLYEDTPDGFKFTLTGDSGADWMTAAGPNPFLNPPGGVPEPGAWALMILGFGGVGAALRRRRLQPFAG